MSYKHLGLVEMTILISLILVFGAVSLLAFIHVCVVGRALGRLNNGDDVTDHERGGPGERSMSKEDLEKLPCYDYIARSTGSSPVDCAVCLDNLKGGDKCRLLPICRHSFHAQCVDAWLMKNPICPICRTSADSEKASKLVVGVGQESSHFSSTDTSFEPRGSTTAESNSRGRLSGQILN